MVVKLLDPLQVLHYRIRCRALLQQRPIEAHVALQLLRCYTPLARVLLIELLRKRDAKW